MKNKGLGRGIDSLIPVGINLEDIAHPSEKIKNVSIAEIETNKDQPRKVFDQDKISELASSISNHGIIQPLILAPKGDKYRIVAGERRYLAAQKAGLKEVPAIIRTHGQQEELEVSIIENVQRVDLSPFEQALSFMRLRDDFGYNNDQIAQKIGKSPTTIVNTMRLLSLPEPAIVALRDNKISEGHARAILAIRLFPQEQVNLLEKIIKNNLTVRDAEEFANKVKKLHLAKSSSVSDKAAEAADKLISKGIKVKLTERKKGGVVSVTYKDASQLEKLLDALNSGI